jgi:thiol-disulfide isomerase/thioredoxin
VAYHLSVADSRTAAPPAPRQGLDARLLFSAVALGLVVTGALAFGLWPAPGSDAPPGDVAVIARGENVEIDPHLAAGKYTLIDFYADWCPNCRRVGPVLDDLARRRPDLAVRKINIVSWDSPVARQYGITVLPHLKLYGPHGELLAEDDSAWDALRRLFS